jgi:hypothetical protein
MIMRGPGSTTTLMRCSRLTVRAIHRATSTVCAHEAAERFAARANYAESAAHIGAGVGRPFCRRGQTAKKAFHALGDALNRRERIVEFMAHYANQALPGLAFLFAERAAQIRQHQQCVLQTAFAEMRAAHHPASGAAGEADLERARGFTFQATRQAQLGGGAAEHAFGRKREQAFTRAIDDAEVLCAVKSENGHVNFLDDFFQKRGGFDRAEALLAQRFAERVHFAHHFAERVGRFGPAAADGIVTFAYGGEQV